MSNSLQAHELQHLCRPLCPSSTPRACSNSCPSIREFRFCHSWLPFGNYVLWNIIWVLLTFYWEKLEKTFNVLYNPFFKGIVNYSVFLQVTTRKIDFSYKRSNCFVSILWSWCIINLLNLSFHFNLQSLESNLWPIVCLYCIYVMHFYYSNWFPILNPYSSFYDHLMFSTFFTYFIVGGLCNFLSSVSPQQKFEAMDRPVL